MELHRIVAPDASKATAEALRLYGPDALVISTRRLKNDRTEIIVATEAAEGQDAVEALDTAAATITPDNAQARAPALEAEGGKAFKAAFEAQLSAPLSSAASKEDVVLPAAPAPTTQAPEAPLPRQKFKAIDATAAARKLARSKKIALGSIPGTGKGGQITQQDVQRALKNRNPLTEPQSAAPTIPHATPSVAASDEGLALLAAIHEELARLRSEVGTLKAERQELVQSQDRDRLEALGIPENAIASVLERMAEGGLAPLPKLSEGAGAQAQWLAQLLTAPEGLDPLEGIHILRAEDTRVQASLAASLAAQGEARHGSGSTLIIAIGQEDGHWRQVAQAALNEGLQVLRARDGAQLASLLASEGLGQRLCLLLPASGEEADALRRLPGLKAVPRHQILPADRLSSPFLSALLGGSETDSVMLHQFHKNVPLEHFVATMLKAGKRVSVLHGDEEGLRDGPEASLTLMAAWAAKDQAPQQPEAGAANAWPLALHG
jgi:hypothetical protein